MAHDTTKSSNITFDSINYGVQQGTFSGQQTNLTNLILLGGKASSPLPPSAIIPFGQDRDFVEREVLKDLLQRANEPGARMGLVGLGGIGKTQVAIEYAYRIQKERPKPWVFWVHASSESRFRESYRSIAQRLQLPGWQEPKADILGMVHNWLSDENNGRWTMVVDNADDEKIIFEQRSGEIDPEAPTMGRAGRSLAEYLPMSPKGSIVLTTRNRKVAEGLIDCANILDLGPMDIDEAVDLLLKKLKKLEGGCAPNDLVDLARQLDCIPLALSQAAAYVNQRAPRVTLSKYLTDIRRSDDGRAQLLLDDPRNPRRDGQHSNSIMTTWYVSFEYIRQAHNSAARLLSLMSLFDREGIPDHLLKGRYLETSRQSGMDFENDITTLRDYSLIGVGTSEQFEMHRLVQFSTKTWLEIRGELEWWQGRYVEILDEAFPSGEYGTWSVCQALFPHVQMLMSDSYRINEERYRRKRAAVLYRGARYAWDNGQYRVVEVMARASLAEREVVLGKDNLQTLDSVFLVACGLRGQGKFHQAQEMHQRALMGREMIPGLEHPDTLQSMSKLAGVLLDQGDDKQAEEIHRRTLVVSEKVLGEDHPDTLISRQSLGAVLSHQGTYAEAEETLRRALVGFEKVLGVDHPDTWTCAQNLGAVLLHQGKYAEAEETFRRALVGLEKVLVVDHPDILNTLQGLGVLLSKQDKYAEAEETLRRSLVGLEKVLGVDHPNTLETIHSLGYVLAAQQKRHEALKLYNRAVDGFTKVLGTGHPRTQDCQGLRTWLLEEMDHGHNMNRLGRSLALLMGKGRDKSQRNGDESLRHKLRNMLRLT
ncbi:hypothetical protein LTR06_005595 [Exophiala xenobiotica]|nr:hypothetical protein LTR06_005595 [Exophiala xenobiotica]